MPLLLKEICNHCANVKHALNADTKQIIVTDMDAGVLKNSKYSQYCNKLLITEGMLERIKRSILFDCSGSF